MPFTCSDPDGDPLAVSILSSPSNGLIGAAGPSGVTYTPSSSFLGTDSFTFRATAHGLSSEPAADSVTVTATPPPGTTEAPDTKITKAKINHRKRKATFNFTALGSATSFQCELKRGRKKARFRSCRAPKIYRKLKPGTYRFEVRAVGSGGPDRTPATKRFVLARPPR
jgi:hypothetical protein